MTTRVKAFLVTLKDDMREDDAETIRVALSMVKGVIEATPVPSDINNYVAESRARTEIYQRILDAIGPKAQS